MKKYAHRAYMGALLTVVSLGVSGQAVATCTDLGIDQATLAAALASSVPASAGGTGPSNGGLDFPMWATLVERGGAVCAVANTGDAWPGSRAISAQKANTANAFSIQSISLSTANLFAPTQPGASLFGLQFSNPVDPRVVFRGDPADHGTATDPMNGLKPGGVNVFGGGLAIYDAAGNVLGAIGVSGDTSCADHNVAWRVRQELGFTNVIGGVGTNGTDTAGGADGIVYDIDANGDSAGGFGHPTCLATEDAVADTLNPMTIL